MSPELTVRRDDVDVIIVGAGPVGTLLAVLLGRKGHRVTVVEKWPKFYARPRGVTFDHEIARILGYVDVDSENDDAIEHHTDLYSLRNADDEALMEVDWNSFSDSGWRTRYWFHQPDLEKRFRKIADSMANVEIISGWHAQGIEENADSITLTGTHRGDPESLEETSQLHEITARYLVGADGANSFVRESLGLEMNDLGYFFDWLILDLIPTQQLEYGPDHWQLCDPKRPTTIVPAGPGRRRWEFMALPGEDLKELAAEETAWKLLEPWDVTPDKAVLERSAIYRFQARWAQEWRRGRGIIAGDAAHLMPPFAGEGLCAGIRDALALAWRLDLILSGSANDDLLDTYEEERREHVRYYIDFSMQIGNAICVLDEEEAAERDRQMIAELKQTQGVPTNSDVAHLGPGIWVGDSPLGGELSKQGIVEVQGERGRFDELVGRGWVVLGLGTDPRSELSGAHMELLERLDATVVSVGMTDNVDVIDAEGLYTRWLSEVGAKFVIIRPDFYNFATAADGAQLQGHLDELGSHLHLVPQPVAHR